MTPKFSVVIPTYNRAKPLVKCLESLVAQTFKDFEVLVCDDGSTDNTQEITQQFTDKLFLHYIYSANSGSPARPRNIGIKNAASEWVCFLDSDDWWYPEKLFVMSQHLDGNDILYHDLDIFNSMGKSGKITARKMHSPVFIDLLYRKNAIPNSSSVVRKSKLFEVNLIAEIPTEDFDLWLRLSQVTEKFLYIPQCLGAYFYSESGDNISSPSKMRLSELAIVDRYFDKIPQDYISHIMLVWFYGTARNLHLRRAFSEARFCYLRYLRHAKICMLPRVFFLYLMTLLQIAI